MNAAIRRVLEAVRDERVTRGTRALARGILEKADRLGALAAAKSCTTAHVARTAIASVAHHEKVRRAEERALEVVADGTWALVLLRTQQDHRLQLCCEACHKPRVLEPHHLELGAGGRRDAPEVVMALCAGCHRTDDGAAHLAPRRFVQTIVIPWARAHGFPLPNRKEYRDAS